MGVDRPILNDVVDPSCRSSIIAWDSAIEGTIASIFGMPFLGFIAQYAFGYMPTNVKLSLMPEHARLHNLHALEISMLVMIVVPWLLCFVLYAGLHWTYKRDLDRIATAKASPKLVDETTPLRTALQLHG